MSDPWDAILEEDEDILWQGRPTTGFCMAQEDLIPLLFGLAFSAFAMLWIALMASTGSSMWLIGLVHFGSGIALTLYAGARDTVARKYSYYTLTSERAIIGLSYPWAEKSLRKTRITKSTRLRQTNDHTVTFGPAGRSKRHPFPLRAPQFTRIDDATKLYDMMRQIQKDTT